MNQIATIKNKIELPLKFIQPKLRIDKPGDKYEQEADEMADRVMRMPSNEYSKKPVTGLIGSSVQRKCTECEEEERKRKPIMRKAENSGYGFEASSDLASYLSSSKGTGSPLSQNTKNFMENAFSAGFSDVRVHTDSRASEMSKDIGAKAFTYGKDIYFNRGQYTPQSVEGKKLLAHELTHVVQQDDKVIRRQLVTPLGAGGGFGGLMERDRARSRQITQQRPPLTTQRVKLWFNTFIPHTTINGPPGSECFLGDARSYSSRINDSSRTHQEIEFQVPTLNVLSEYKRIGTTHEVDCNFRQEIDSGTASTNELYTSNPRPGSVTRYSANEILVLVIVSATNPLVTFAPSIDAVVYFHIDPYNRYCYLTGLHDGFPGYEAYISADGGPGIRVYGFDPIGAGNSISSLFPPMDVTINSTGSRF